MGCGEGCGTALEQHCTHIPTAGGMKGADKWRGRAAQGAEAALWAQAKVLQSAGAGKTSELHKGRRGIDSFWVCFFFFL